LIELEWCMIPTTIIMMTSLTATAAAVSSPSAVPSLRGQLFPYAENSRVAFESPLLQQDDDDDDSSTLPLLSPRKCVLLGGLSDGLWPVPYTVRLERACRDAGCWSLVQPVLSGSYTGFGHGSLDRDAAELDELLQFLCLHRRAEQVAIVGHSTGCQDIVHYLKHGKSEWISKVVVAVLQAPVSDREAATVRDDPVVLQHRLETANKMREGGRGDEMMPREAFWAPITAARYLDLMEVGGRDDYFSSDYTDEQLAERLSHVGELTQLQHCLVAVSGSDEYVPTGIDTETLMQRICRAMNAASSRNEPPAVGLYLPAANHNLSESAGDADAFIAKVRELLQGVAHNSS
jgi:pimeloyl-ACP methyl ester carboxylesterase